MLQVENLTLYQDHSKVLSGLDVTFSPGEFWAIIGANGVGKSTLLQTLAGIHPNYQGNICVDDHLLQDLDPLSRARRMGFLFQEQEASLAVSVREAVGMGRFPWRTSKAQDQSITTAALERCLITHLAERSILKLSGGERRKVEIATCLAQQSRYLLLDEPLNHLDLVYRHHILKVFESLSQKHAVVMVCHDLEAVRSHCSHVLMLFGNNCYLSGTSATMLTAENKQRLFNESSREL